MFKLVRSVPCRVWLVVVLLSLVGVVAPGERAHAEAGDEISISLGGSSCLAGTNKFLPGPWSMAANEVITVQLRCYVNPTNANMDTQVTAIWAMAASGTNALQGVAHTTHGTINCNTSSGNSYTITQRGQKRLSTGVVSGTMIGSNVPMNYIAITMECKNQVGTFGSGFGTSTTNSFYLSFTGTTMEGLQVTSGTFALPAQQVGTSQHRQSIGGTAYITVQYETGSAAWILMGASEPDTFGSGGGFADLPCDGIVFELREDGVPLTLPFGDGDESKTYVLRAYLDDVVDTDDVLTFWFDADASGDIAGPTYLGTANTAGTLAYVQFNVSSMIAALEDPTPDLGEVEAQCRSENTVGAWYWDGTTGDSPVLPPLDQLEVEDDEASIAECVTVDGMSLTNPATWVAGLGRMGVCLVRFMFVPEDGFVGEKLGELNEAIGEQLPFSFAYMLIDFATSMNAAMEDSSASGCFDTGGSFSFGSYGSVPVADVCLSGAGSGAGGGAGGFSLSTANRQKLATLFVFAVWFGVARHAFNTVRGVAQGTGGDMFDSDGRET